MRDPPQAVVVKTVGTLFQLGTTGDRSDSDLLDCFVSRDGETQSAAFEVLIDRHGPMVLDVCRNFLRDYHDAEDAFQATFLILARQARMIRRRGSVGSWLFGVATRVASRARVETARHGHGSKHLPGMSLHALTRATTTRRKPPSTRRSRDCLRSTAN